jgi:hypothetical protein
MRRLPRVLIVVALLLGADSVAQAQSFLYKAMFVRAAPGKLLELIALYKERMPVYDAAGDVRPFWIRHSQGDQWDLMLLFPMESWPAYYSAGRIARRNAAAAKSRLPQADFARKFYELAAWHEEVFVEGPPLETVRKHFEGAGFFHLEIFMALPGKQGELRKQREMENAYLTGMGRPANLIFTHDQGAAWDLFTLGFYRDLKHYAESADIPPAKQDAAAKAAGFAGADAVGPYLRTLIASHHDTLALAVK